MILYLTTINNLNTIRKEPTEKCKIQLIYFNATVTFEFGRVTDPSTKGQNPETRKSQSKGFHTPGWLNRWHVKKRRDNTQFLHVKSESAVKHPNLQFTQEAKTWQSNPDSPFHNTQQILTGVNKSREYWLVPLWCSFNQHTEWSFGTQHSDQICWINQVTKLVITLQ